MRASPLALMVALAVCHPAFCHDIREGKRPDRVVSKRHGRGHDDRFQEKVNDSERTERQVQSEEKVKVPPRAQTLGRDQSGVFVNESASNAAYSPSFVMRGFPAGVTLFDGAAHGFTAQSVDLSTIDHVEFFKGPSAMLFGKALGGYGGAANYIRKSPTEETFAQSAGSLGSFGLKRLTLDVNSALYGNKNFLFRLTGSAQTLGSFVKFVRSRSFDIAPMIAFTADNGDKVTVRAEHNGGRFVYHDGVPADPIFFNIPREFYAGIPANEHETPFYDDVTLTYDHAFASDWKLSAIADYNLFANRWGWFTSWG
jgi:iron complex outermembrane receptor protein